MEDRLRKALQTQNELVEAVRILVDVLWKMGRYIYMRTTDAELKSNLLNLGEEIKLIKIPRKR